MTTATRRFSAGLAVALAAAAAGAAELGRFEITEPLGVDWRHEWITHDVTIDTAGREVPPGRLQIETAIEEIVQEGGKKKTVRRELVLPVQFYDPATGKLLDADRPVSGKVKLRAFFAAVVPEGKTQAYAITDGGGAKPAWQGVAVTTRGKATVVTNGLYELAFDPDKPLPINAIRTGSVKGTMGTFHWPEGLRVDRVDDRWIERGRARAILERRFSFQPARKAPDWFAPQEGLHYVIRLDFRAGEAWIDVADDYWLGAGSFIRLDLAGLNADFVYHPHTYNARTFKPDGRAEDSTIQPPQHPIATLGPIWRDIWFGGGPYAFVYNSQADCGIGLAAVRGSCWQSPDGVSLESQNLYVNGDAERPGKVWVKIPTDGGRDRRWAIVPGPPELRKRMGALVRMRADVPLEKVLKNWVTRWDSDFPDHSFGLAWQWFGPFNRHILNPTTFPRNASKHLRPLVAKGAKVHSRDLALLAYAFSDPDYWPGPRYRWVIGNPNFNTDMYNVVLQVGLVMPDHPHAKRWIAHGAGELKTNVYRDSYPSGAWAESLGYSGAVFGIARYAEMARAGGAGNPFRDWPRLKKVLTYLACMHTPVDPRYGCRQKAPIGDTSPGNYVGALERVAANYRGVDDRFAEQLARFGENWPGALDIGSREFFGFGAMMRGNAYDDRHESFVTVKAGPARNHFQGDELSFFFASLGTPLAIDYACHYSPRPWSAAMHNRPNLTDVRPAAIAVRRAMVTSEAADVFVADEKTHRINHVPMEPHRATKPGWNYPWSDLPPNRPWVVRRYTMLVKHDPKACGIADYLAVRDEIISPDRPWWNLHVLARDIELAGQRAFFPGQLDVDLNVHFLTPKVETVEKRRWGWGGSTAERRGLKGADYEKACFGRYVPKDFKRGSWKGGEMAQWLRVAGQAGRSNWFVLLVPHLRGKPAPKVERLSDTSARVSLGGDSEVIHLGSEGTCQAAVERGGKVVTLLKAGQVKPPEQLEFRPIPPDVDQGAL